MKKLEIEKTKPTFFISVLKVDIIKVGLVFSISNFFITKTPLANNWRRKKIPSCSYLALEETTKNSSKSSSINSSKNLSIRQKLRQKIGQKIGQKKDVKRIHQKIRQ